MSNIHNEWDERYSQHDHIYGEQANAFIQEITQKLPIQGKTLGLAEGEGRNLLYLAALAQTKGQTFEADLWDYSQVALDKAQGYAQQRGLSLNTQKQDLSQVNWQANQY
ncbi:MAG: SAM-dependent methyltransferase, partial [Gammaproteobacteria bacterium]|nr:SAM-dependent methyltransferase [Gammaproteobacteria bacterium]